MMDNINPIPAVITNNMTIGMITANEINVKWSPVKYITAMSMINDPDQMEKLGKLLKFAGEIKR